MIRLSEYDMRRLASLRHLQNNSYLLALTSGVTGGVVVAALIKNNIWLLMAAVVLLAAAHVCDRWVSKAGLMMFDLDAEQARLDDRRVRPADAPPKK